ncbi:MAG: XTP/dITP diphosphohydrolase [Cellvibrionaceae bacterium]|jgi:XTP/dITP diphosphohydrolase
MKNSFDTIVLASNNAGKLHELQDMLSSSDIKVIPQAAFEVADAIEDGLSFVENAIIKARHACKQTGLPAIADDSGLEVDYLQGEPGIYSARYSGLHGDDKGHNRVILEKLKSVPHRDRRARFQCVLAFMRHANDPTPLICQASWQGFILEAEQGSHGFGYDPLFWVPEKSCSAAELPKEEKYRLSHRGRALKLFLQMFRETYCS